jgi:dTDP-4-dehydrorhamnose 3,5-epimerase
MKVIQQCLECKLLEINRIRDNRGWFQVAFCLSDIKAIGVEFAGVEQLNHSMTEKAGVIRGLNYQSHPFNQAKLVRCTKGRLYSVAVDIDYDSPNYGKWCGFELSADNRYIMYIPNTYAHGFITMEDNTELEYFTDNKYSFEHTESIRYDDPNIAIDWSFNGRIAICETILSEKNKNAPYLKV